MHGHNYELEVVLSGEPITGGAQHGMLMSFNNIDAIVSLEVVDLVDHTVLNERLAYPTTELTAGWMLRKLEPAFHGLLHMVRLRETRRGWVEVTV